MYPLDCPNDQSQPVIRDTHSGGEGKPQPTSARVGGSARRVRGPCRRGVARLRARRRRRRRRRPWRWYRGGARGGAATRVKGAVRAGAWMGSVGVGTRARDAGA